MTVPGTSPLRVTAQGDLGALYSRVLHGPARFQPSRRDSSPLPSTARPPAANSRMSYEIATGRHGGIAGGLRHLVRQAGTARGPDHAGRLHGCGARPGDRRGHTGGGFARLAIAGWRCRLCGRHRLAGAGSPRRWSRMSWLANWEGLTMAFACLSGAGARGGPPGQARRPGGRRAEAGLPLLAGSDASGCNDPRARTAAGAAPGLIPDRTAEPGGSCRRGAGNPSCPGSGPGGCGRSARLCTPQRRSARRRGPG
jgi:hypothetical protein